MKLKRIDREIDSQTFLSISKNQVYNKLIHPSSQQKTKNVRAVVRGDADGFKRLNLRV